MSHHTKPDTLSLGAVGLFALVGAAIAGVVVAGTAASLFAAQGGLQEATVADYEVYSSYLRAQLVAKRGPDDIRVGERGSVLAPTTGPMAKPLAKEKRRNLTHGLKSIRDDTLQAFESCADHSLRLSHQFTLPVEYQIASANDLTSVDNLYARYPRTHGYIQFSCVGFNPSRTQALFLVQRLMSHDAVARYVLMEKDSTSQWVVKQELIVWIA